MARRCLPGRNFELTIVVNTQSDDHSLPGCSNNLKDRLNPYDQSNRVAWQDTPDGVNLPHRDRLTLLLIVH